MNLHEYQAKQFFKKYNIDVPEGFLANNLNEVKQIMEDHFLNDRVVLKAQIHSGGRGKAGGVLLADNCDEAIDKAKELFGKKLVTKQTGPSGKIVKKIYIEKQSNIDREIYLSELIDTNTGKHTFVVCKDGGTSIEELAETNPEAIIKLAIDPDVGFNVDDALSASKKMELDENNTKQFVSIMQRMHEMFIKEDCTLIEVNPLALCDDKLIALDGKVILDSDALFRHQENISLQDKDEEDPLELQASENGMNYVSLDGNIACICNGAGLGMSTMDTIYHYGGKPANFMDTGGTITIEKAYKAFEIVTRASNVEAVVINIFGGIARTDLIAEGVCKAIEDLNYKKPVVARIEGNKAEIAHETLENCKVKITLAENCSDAVIKALDLLNKGENQ